VMVCALAITEKHNSIPKSEKIDLKLECFIFTLLLLYIIISM